MIKFLEKYLTPQFLKQWNLEFLKNLPFVAKSKCIIVAWFCIIFNLFICGLIHLTPVSVANSYISFITLVVFISVIGVSTTILLVIYLGWVSTTIKTIDSWKNLTINYFCNFGISILFALIPLCVAYTLNVKHKVIIEADELGSDIALLNLSAKYYYNSINKQDIYWTSINEYKDNEIVDYKSLFRNNSFDSLYITPRYNTLDQAHELLTENASKHNFLKEKLEKLLIKYNIPLSYEMITKLDDKLDTLYIEKTRTPLLFNYNIIYLFCILLIIPQFITYIKVSSFFKYIGQLLVVLILITTLLFLLDYFFSDTIRAIRLNTSQLKYFGFLIFLFPLSNVLKNSKTTTSIRTLVIIQVCTLTLFYYYFILQPFSLLISSILTSVIFGCLGNTINRYPLREKGIVQQLSFSKKINALNNHFLLKRYPLLWDARFILVLVLAFSFSLLSAYFAHADSTNILYVANGLTTVIGIDLMKIIIVATIPISTWAIFYRKKKLLSLSSYPTLQLKVLLIILSVFSGFYFAIRVHYQVRINQVSSFFTKQEIAQDIKTLTALDISLEETRYYGNPIYETGLYSLSDSIGSISIADTLQLTNINSLEISKADVQGLFNKYGFKLPFNAIADLKTNDTYKESRKQLNSLLDSIIRTKFLTNKRWSENYMTLSFMFLFVILLFYKKTVDFAHWGLIYFLSIYLHLLVDPFSLGLNKWNTFNYSTNVIISLLLVFTCVFGFKSGSKNITIGSFILLMTMIYQFSINYFESLGWHDNHSLSFLVLLLPLSLIFALNVFIGNRLFALPA